MLEAHHPASTVARYLRAADFCYVGSLHDGMNLVSKEFVREREDERGVLVLSAFAGAAQELTDALIVNPYDVDAAATAFDRALDMPLPEQRDRLRRMRTTVAGHDAGDWASSILASVAPLEPAVAERRRPSIASALAPNQLSSAGVFRCFCFLKIRFDLSSCVPPVCRGSGARGSFGLARTRRSFRVTVAPGELPQTSGLRDGFQFVATAWSSCYTLSL